MPDNGQGQVSMPESPHVGNQGQESGQPKVEISEVAGKAAAPQPIAPVNDKTAIQSVQNSLQNSQPQAQPNNVNTQGANPAPAGKPANSDPYIKAAENVIEKDKTDPYKEEEDHEDVQVKYLHDRFGKDIKRD